VRRLRRLARPCPRGPPAVFPTPRRSRSAAGGHPRPIGAGARVLAREQASLAATRARPIDPAREALTLTRPRADVRGPRPTGSPRCARPRRYIGGGVSEFFSHLHRRVRSPSRSRPPWMGAPEARCRCRSARDSCLRATIGGHLPHCASAPTRRASRSISSSSPPTTRSTQTFGPAAAGLGPSLRRDPAEVLRFGISRDGSKATNIRAAAVAAR